MRYQKIKFIFSFIAVALFSSCTGSGGSDSGSLGGYAAPPASIPAPTVAYMSVSSPDEEGNVFVTGGENSATSGALIEVYKSLDPKDFKDALSQHFRKSLALSGPYCNVTVDAQGAFSCDVPAEKEELLCIKQVLADGSSSDCANYTVPLNKPAFKLSAILDISLDETWNHTYILGKDKDDKVHIKIFNNSSETLVRSIDLASIFPNLDLSQVTSVSAHQGFVLLSDPSNERVWRFKLDFSGLLLGAISSTLTSSQQGGVCERPLKVRWFPLPLDAGETYFLVACSNDNNSQLRLVGYSSNSSFQNLAHARTDPMNISMENTDKINLSSPGGINHWFVAIPETVAQGDRTRILYIAPDNQGVWISKDEIILNQLAQTRSSGKVQGEDIYLGVLENTGLGLFLKSVQLTDVVETQFSISEGVKVDDALCFKRENCSLGYFLSSETRKVYEVNFSTGSPVLGQSFDVTAIKPMRMLMDEVNGKISVIDYVAQSVHWITLP